MTIYIIMAMTLLLGAIYCAINPKFRGFYFTVIFIVSIFTGLRYNIGYDWLAYERYYQSLSYQFSLLNYNNINSSVLQVEPLFYYLVYFVKYSIGSFDFLLFIISVFNIFVIGWASRNLSKESVVFCFLIYFCVALIAIQFNIIRQSIASSFVIISCIMAVRGRNYYSLFFFVCALGFHVSSLMFLPVIFLIRQKISIKIVYIAIFILIIIFMTNTIVVNRAIGLVSSYLPSFLASKADSYAESITGGGPVSILTIVLMMFHALMVLVFSKQRNPEENLAFRLSLLVLIFHLAFSEFPSIWNRGMAVSLPIQGAMLWKFASKRYSPVFNGLAVTVIGAVAITGMALQLKNERALPFVPYHSLVQVWLFGDEGDGRARSEYAVRRADLERNQ